MTNREKFEAWAKKKNCDLEKFSRGEKSGQYKNPVVEKMCEAYLAALASQQPADDVWIDWAGGECPVAAGTRVDLKLQIGHITLDFGAEVADWSQDGHPYDIVAYRVVKP